eukprot:scaffold479826_cov63-Attheya_sp.AAC.2
MARSSRTMTCRCQDVPQSEPCSPDRTTKTDSSSILNAIIPYAHSLLQQRQRTSILIGDA